MKMKKFILIGAVVIIGFYSYESYKSKISPPVQKVQVQPVQVQTNLPSASKAQCQLNAGAYIAHEKKYIDEAYNNVWNGRWGALSVMHNQGKLKKINRNWNINTIYVGKNIVKFSVKVAPGKEIYTLKIFTTCK